MTQFESCDPNQPKPKVNPDCCYTQTKENVSVETYAQLYSDHFFTGNYNIAKAFGIPLNCRVFVGEQLAPDTFRLRITSVKKQIVNTMTTFTPGYKMCFG